jgi:hypothetical protein
VPQVGRVDFLAVEAPYGAVWVGLNGDPVRIDQLDLRWPGDGDPVCDDTHDVAA